MIAYTLLTNFAATCSGGSFLGFPKWYKYLDAAPIVGANNTCSPQVTSLTDVWLIVAAIIEILLRVSALLAVVFIIYGGFSYTTSQGDPEATSRAKNTLTNALIGLAIAVTATAVVSFIAKSVG
jgi:ABC-type Fe3+ transport system permease subunit